MSQVIGKCGNICSSCPWSHHVHDKIRPDQWAEYAREVKRYTGYSPTRNPCRGCQTPNEHLAKNVGVHRAVMACSARSCALDTGIANCAHCSRYPCDKMLLLSSANTREATEKRLSGPISDAAYGSYVRIFRGMEQLDPIHSSLAPENLVAPRSVGDEAVAIVGFPDDLSLPEDQVMDYRRLHSRLSSIISSKFGLSHSDTLANYQTLVDRRDLVLGLLWMIGSHGELSDDEMSLTVDSSTVAASKKRVKGIPHSEEQWQRVFRLLESARIKCKFIPLADNRTTPSGWLREKAPGSDKPAWSIQVSFSSDWGGPKAAGVFQSYARHLSADHRKSAYSRFTRADMRGLKS